MKIEIRPIDNESLHLRISTPDNNCHNFIVPQDKNARRGEYSFDYSYESMNKLYKLLGKFINR